MEFDRKFLWKNAHHYRVKHNLKEWEELARFREEVFPFNISGDRDEM
jgi:hypothetical protein